MTRKTTPYRIVIVGSGFGGIAMAIALKKAGFGEFSIVERSGDIGGVWRDNIYPGAACDVPSRLYSYSFEQKYDWSEAFAPQREIHDYLRRCAEKYGVLPHIRFNTEIESAAFDEKAGSWTLRSTAGETIEADIFISAMGLFNQAKLPDIPGREDFTGTSFHSSHWNQDYALDGKTVAVIGTGASAIQFVPEIAKQVDHLSVFQRTPHYIMPKEKRGSSPAERSRFQRSMLGRELERFKIFLNMEKGTRRRSSIPKTEAAEQVFLRGLERQVPDPALRAKLTPDYHLGCKRVLRSDSWYPALQRPNVELVDTPIECIYASGIKTLDGQAREFDAIIHGTGFTPTDFLSPQKLTGLNGMELNQAWRDGAEAYLGVTIAGFPNLFMMYGPNTNLSGSIIFMLESQSRYIVRCLRSLRRRKARYMAVNQEAQRKLNEEIQRRIAATVIMDDNCHSYFKTAAGKVTTQWPGYLTEYRLRTSRVHAGDYLFAP
ncbi:MAG: NAD(P)/FAD-dependent oxidoreductase [Proteobacteria bacterium]|nr:NAD(P)/FAD-dependent oxidoreductase [Pseudomonadota bacterium]